MSIDSAVSKLKGSNGVVKRRYNPLTDGVRWIEKYSSDLEKIFEKIPDFIARYIASLAIITFGATLKGEWIVVLAAAMRHLSGADLERRMSNETTESLLTLDNLKMTGFWSFFFGAHAVSYTMYFGIGGFLHWYFYMNRRNKPEEWKCQPDKWLPQELELHEIKIGIMSLFVTGTFSAFLGTYFYNGNPSMVYFKFDEYGWPWFFAQFIVLFIYLDYVTYIMHRLYHTPWLYKNFHKLHHKYKQPTAFSVTAIHPVEIMHIQLCLCSPLFLFPVHLLPFYSVFVYNYYHGILDHSGINFKAQWWQPWQPDAKFHDLHHEFFHVNFGFNMTLWDRIHGTVRKENRVYTEDTFVGQAPLIEEYEKMKADENALNGLHKRIDQNGIANGKLAKIGSKDQ